MRSLPGRHLHHSLVRRRRSLLGAGGLAALFAVLGPGILAGLSDDDPAGITTYSVLGAKYGYEMIWVLTLSTIALIVFHLLAARMGVVTKKGLMTLLRENYGKRATLTAGPALLIANLGTLCAEFAGVAAGMSLLLGVSKYVSVPVAAVFIGLLVLRGSFKYVEHALLLLSTVFVAYIVAGFLAHPDWAAAVKGAVVPQMPMTRDAVLIAVATIGTTLAPWGLTFIQSYAVNKKIQIEDIRYEGIDVITGAVMTGVIGFFVVVACAATLHVEGVDVKTARDAALALEPVAGHLAARLFGIGFLGAALLAAAIVPLATAYSMAEATGEPADIDDSFGEAKAFYLVFIGMMIVAAAIVLIPGAPLVQILVLSQALNAVLLLPILPFMRHVARREEVMGEFALGTTGVFITGVTIGLIVLSVCALGYLSLASAVG
jgi:NRAMP (natural resistance-associated macrophage protein)-like metal ion transporter